MAIPSDVASRTIICQLALGEGFYKLQILVYEYG